MIALIVTTVSRYWCYTCLPCHSLVEELQGEGGHVSFFPTILRSILKLGNNIEEYFKAVHISSLQQY